MKGVRGKLLNKLKSVRPIGYLRQDRVLQVSASDRRSVLQEQSNVNQTQSSVKFKEPEIIDVSELLKDLGDDYDDKENVGPPPLVEAKDCSAASENFAEVVSPETEDEQSGIDEAENTTSSDNDVTSFRRPKLSSRSLFDPKLLAAFRKAVKEHVRMIEAERRARSEKQSPRNIKEAEHEPPLKARRIDEDQNEDLDLDPLLGFEEKCPPGGDVAVIFYTTTLRGIRKTFENCSSVRFLLETFRVVFIERDLSMHVEFREELRRVLHGEAAVPPKLFIKGRYIGGAEEVLRLHEQGKLRPLFQGVPIDRSAGPCQGCAGVRFVVCSNCSGGRRTVSDDGLWTVCLECNENGLLICPICC